VAVIIPLLPKPDEAIVTNRLKVHFIHFPGFAMAFLASIGTVTADYQSIVGTKHNLSTNPAVTGNVGVCAYCHEVNEESGEVSDQLSRSKPISTFKLYEGATLDKKNTVLGSVSLHCLSCHDGVTPFDALSGSNGTESNNMNTLYPGSSAIMGDDLNNHHPVGAIFSDKYDSEKFATITSAGLKVYDNRLECSSCHDVHGESGFAGFLRKDNAASSLCLTCHIDK
jgi:predicted CXXCH cytochrome family protein